MTGLRSVGTMMPVLLVAALAPGCRRPTAAVQPAPAAVAPTDPVSALAAEFLATAARRDLVRARALFDLETHVYARLPVAGLPASGTLGADRPATEKKVLENVFQYLAEARCRPNGDRQKARVVAKPAAKDDVGRWFTSITALETVGLACEREAVVPMNARVAVEQKLVGLVIVTRQGLGTRVADLLMDDSGWIYGHLAAGLERDPEKEARAKKGEEERERAEQERAPIIEYADRAVAPPVARPRRATRDGCDFDGDGRTDFVVIARAADGLHGPLVFLGKDHPWKARPTTPLIVDAPPTAPLDALCAGDVNGDGLDDVLVSLINLHPPVDALQIHLGSSAGVSRRAGSRITAPTGSSPSLSWRYGGIGDVNGDGRDDLLVVNAVPDRVRLFLGAPTGVDVEPVLSIVGARDAQFGRPFVGTDDLDGDGRGDLVILAGARRRAYVFRGGPRGLAPEIHQEISLPYHFAGPSMAFGDLNGDGKGEIVIASGQQMLGERTGGTLLIYRQAGGRFVEQAEALSPGISASYGGFGETLAYVGDLDGDRLGDVASGAPSASPGLRGGIYIFFGHRSGAARPALKLDGTGAESSRFGHGLIASGDFDHDGHRDLVVQDVGATYFWQGRARTLVPLVPR